MIVCTERARAPWHREKFCTTRKLRLIERNIELSENAGLGWHKPKNHQFPSISTTNNTLQNGKPTSNLRNCKSSLTGQHCACAQPPTHVTNCCQAFGLFFQVFLNAA